MTLWRPNNQIRVKAIGLLRKEEKFLAAEVKRDDGTTKGVRPLGGTLEFGETWQQALRREFKEELRTEINILSAPIILENIFRHEGTLGHEIIFVAEIRAPEAFYQRHSPVYFKEDGGTRHKADWFSLSDLTTKGLDLYPNGLTKYLTV